MRDRTINDVLKILQYLRPIVEGVNQFVYPAGKPMLESL